MNEYEIKTIHTYDAFLTLKDDWDRCCEVDECASIFLTHDWFENFIHEVIDDKHRLSIYLLSRDSLTLAIFPLMETVSRIFGVRARCISFLANYYSPIAKPIWGTKVRNERQEMSRLLVRHLLGEEICWEIMNLDQRPQEAGDCELLCSALESEGITYTNYLCSSNWYQPTRGMTAEDYEACLPSRVVNTIRRRLKRAEKREPVECRILTSLDEVTNHIDDYYVVYSQSWKQPEPYPNFHRRLAKRLAEKEQVLLGVVYFMGQPVAAQIWLLSHGVASILKLCYHRAFKEFSFGTILTHRLISFVIDKKRVVEIDYLAGDDAYKRDWMSERRDRHGIRAFSRSSLKSRFLWMVEMVLKPALKRALYRSETR